MGATKTLEFLKRVWTDRQSWVDIPSKINGHWIPWSIEWPDEDLAGIRITTAVADDEDVYFSPAQYKNRGRRYEDVLPTYWLWADLDRVTPGGRLYTDTRVGIVASEVPGFVGVGPRL